LPDIFIIFSKADRDLRDDGISNLDLVQYLSATNTCR